MPEQNTPEDVPVYAEPQPVPAGAQPPVADADDHPDFLVEDLRDTNDEPEDLEAPEQSTEPDFELGDTDEEETV